VWTSAASAFVTSARHVSLRWPRGQFLFVRYVRRIPFEGRAQPYTVLWPRAESTTQFVARSPGLHLPLATWMRTTFVPTAEHPKTTVGRCAAAVPVPNVRVATKMLASSTRIASDGLTRTVADDRQPVGRRHPPIGTHVVTRPNCTSPLLPPVVG
jgi:hypothetical protein